MITDVIDHGETRARRFRYSDIPTRTKHVRRRVRARNAHNRRFVETRVFRDTELQVQRGDDYGRETSISRRQEGARESVTA